MALKVYVGMSGGVDSSLSAALLKMQGYDVTGVYMKNWTQDLPGMKCPWADDLADAKRVAVQLDIPFKVFDFQTEYKHKVVDYMIAEYKAGRTPNPDIMCNQEVKFKLFLETALADGADLIATGHYARISCPGTTKLRLANRAAAGITLASGDAKEGTPPTRSWYPSEDTVGGALAAGPEGSFLELSAPRASSLRAPSHPSSPGTAAGGWCTLPPRHSGLTQDMGLPDWPSGSLVVPQAQLLVAIDTSKDQTYFLYRVTEDALSKTLFPLGDMTKPEVRAKAAKLGLATAGKKDSQGICFVGKVGIKEFLQQYVTADPGDIVDKKTGLVIGQHDGAIFYTFGQRHGLGVGGGLPYYVVGKDMDKNIVYVTSDLNDDSLWRDRLRLDQLHWINQAPDAGKTYRVRTRYRAPLVECTISQAGGAFTLTLAEPERAITPGQSAVLYDGDRVVGGGIVAETLA
jgi:tRNA-uridine 2-sulfurtransferase